MVVFVDLVKAFDTVNRDMLMKILARFGLPKPLINVIRRKGDPPPIQTGKNEIQIGQTNT